MKTYFDKKNNLIVYEYHFKAKGVKQKVIYQFSDVHLTEYDEFSQDGERAFAIYQAPRWENMRKYYANAYKEPYGDAQQIPPLEHLKNLISLSKEGDAVIMAGDILDVTSGANLRALNSAVKSLDKPYVYVCGNHEPSGELPEGFIAKNPTQKIDLGDLLILGFNNEERIITKSQLEFLKENLSLNKNVIVAMHVPILCDSNRQKVEKLGEYFRLNNDNSTAETLEFIDVINKNSDTVIMVTCGHLHFNLESSLDSGIPQVISSQGITGSINKYVIGEVYE
ncbi:MAG: metallophosphoesterase [Clostridia bacterium]|nr:metallophosphoesterase [Clostridia bacterium]